MLFAWRLVSLIAVAIMAMGCATVTTGRAQAIAVVTDPDGADCTFTRDKQVLARIYPTPGTILVGKSSSNIEVACKREGYQDATVTIGSEFQAMTLGNVIIGGLVGIVVDAASGAMNRYPESLQFALLPLEFKSSEERDSFFATLQTTFLSRHEEQIASIRQSCKQDCEAQLRSAEAARTDRIADIEKRRLLARVAGMPAPAETASVGQRGYLTRAEILAATQGASWEVDQAGSVVRWDFSASAVYSAAPLGSMRHVAEWRITPRNELCLTWSAKARTDGCYFVARDGDRLLLFDASRPGVQVATAQVK